MLPGSSRLRTRGASLIASSLVALAVAGCSVPVVGSGTGNDPSRATAVSASSPSDTADISRVVTRSFRDTHPAVCTGLYTQNLLDQLTGKVGFIALRECKSELKRTRRARAVAVSHIQLSGGTASAVAVPGGGDSDGIRYRMSLVKTEGVWKIDRLESAKILDRSRVEADFTRGLGKVFSKYIPQRKTECIATHMLDGLSNARLERIMLSGNDNYGVRSYQQCDALRPLFVAGLRKALSKKDAPQGFKDCVVGGVMQAISDREMLAVVKADATGRSTPPRLTALLRRTMIACAPATSAGAARSS
jgi:hypothetical protein